jgi:hypothetical protein
MHDRKCRAQGMTLGSAIYRIFLIMVLMTIVLGVGAAINQGDRERQTAPVRGGCTITAHKISC